MTTRKVTKLIISESTTRSGDKQLYDVDVTPNYTFVKKCMYCTLAIKSIIIGCPTHLISEHLDIKHNARKSANEYMTYGVFCSYNCAKAFAISKEHDPLFSNSSRYLTIMASKESKELVDIIPSPPIELMMSYGGYMTDDQYISEIGKICYTPNGTTVTYPLTLMYSKNVHV